MIGFIFITITNPQEQDSYLHAHTSTHRKHHLYEWFHIICYYICYYANEVILRISIEFVQILLLNCVIWPWFYQILENLRKHICVSQNGRQWGCRCTIKKNWLLLCCNMSICTIKTTNNKNGDLHVFHQNVAWLSLFWKNIFMLCHYIVKWGQCHFLAKFDAIFEVKNPITGY